MCLLDGIAGVGKLDTMKKSAEYWASSGFIFLRSICCGYLVTLLPLANKLDSTMFFYRMRAIRVFIVITTILAVQSTEPSIAHAYIDPNTGGYVFQILFPIISLIAAIYLFCKKQVLSLLAKFAGLFKKKRDGDF